MYHVFRDWIVDDRAIIGRWMQWQNICRFSIFGFVHLEFEIKT